MKNIQIKKLLLLNFPYVICFYIVDKGAWLFRHCTGDSWIIRMGVMLSNFKLAFVSWLPSLHLYDLLAGAVAAVLLKLIVVYRGKNAKKFRKGEESPIYLNIPMVSAIMQSVSGPELALALAKCGGVSFIYGSQSIEEEAAMVAEVKAYKAGFVISDSNLSPDATLEDVLLLKEKTKHSTVAVTADGTSHGKLLGIITSRDYRVSRLSRDTKVADFMTPLSELITGKAGISLSEANDLIWEHKLNALPVIDDEGNMLYFVFRKDYDEHKDNPDELLDAKKRYVVGAGINTRDYENRVPALLEAGADVLCIDSSEGYTEWQKRTIDYIRGA